VEEGLSLEGEIVRYPVSLSLTLTRNEKVEQYIRKNTHKNDPIPLYGKLLESHSNFEFTPFLARRKIGSKKGAGGERSER